MTDIEKIKDMLNKQDTLNCLTNGDDWRSGLTDKGKVINWPRCIRRELMELADSFPWEHWKGIDRKPDIDNALIELTDTWFFIMSHILMKYNTITPELVTDIYDQLTIKLLVKDDDIPSLTDSVIAATFRIPGPKEKEYGYLIFKFSKLMYGMDVNLDLLYKLYNGKLVLNKFRQDNVYKEGIYKKIWDNKEDNVHMLDIIKTNKDISNDTLYKALTNRYASLT